MKITSHLCSFLVDELFYSGHINEAEKSIYFYCFDFLLDFLLYNISILCLGLVTNNFVISLCYIFTMSPLKMIAGGAHAKTQLKCSVLSYSIALISILLVPMKYINSIFNTVVFITCSIIIIFLAPVEHRNKHHNAEEKRKLKIYCILYIIIIGVVFTILYLNKLKTYYCTISLCTVIIVINMIIGIFINKQSERRLPNLETKNNIM